MVLSSGQATVFFENTNKMAIPNTTRIQLQSEGFTSLDDLVDFDTDNIITISDNMMRPRERVLDPNLNSPAGDTLSVLVQKCDSCKSLFLHYKNRTFPCNHP